MDKEEERLRRQEKKNRRKRRRRRKEEEEEDILLAIDCDACSAVSQLFTSLCFGEVHLYLVRSNCECMIRPDVAL